MTSRAFDIPAGSGPAVLYLVRHAAARAELSMCPGCPRCLKTPVLDVLKLGTAGGTRALIFEPRVPLRSPGFVALRAMAAWKSSEPNVARGSLRMAPVT